MAIKRMDHVGIVVRDLTSATQFFVELGLELQGQDSVGGEWADRVVGLKGIKADIAFLTTPDGHSSLELAQFHSPETPEGDPLAAPNMPGIRHLTFQIEDIDAVVARLKAMGAELVGEMGRYEDIYKLCYIRGPEGIIIELAERLG